MPLPDAAEFAMLVLKVERFDVVLVATPGVDRDRTASWEVLAVVVVSDVREIPSPAATKPPMPWVVELSSGALFVYSEEVDVVILELICAGIEDTVLLRIKPGHW
jgi:hypothetical protein